ncbi:hypothetical protein ACFS07_24990 [Undibacterium arcticum]
MANNVHKIPRPSGEQNEIQRELSRMIGEVSRGWRQQMNLRLKPFGLNLSMRQVLLQLHRNPGGLQQKKSWRTNSASKVRRWYACWINSSAMHGYSGSPRCMTSAARTWC